MGGSDLSTSERAWAGLVSFGIVGLVLVPMRQFLRPVDERVDGFPLSFYPMFSDHLDKYWKLSYAVGVHADGRRVNLPYHVLGTGGVNQVRKQLFRAVLRRRAAEHAQLLASRVGAHPDGAGVVRVEIVRGEFDLDHCVLSRRTQPGSETVLASADVPRADVAAAGAVTAEASILADAGRSAR